MFLKIPCQVFEKIQNKFSLLWCPPLFFNQRFALCQYVFDMVIFLNFFYVFFNICYYESVGTYSLWGLMVLWKKIPIIGQWQVPNKKYSHVRLEVQQEPSTYRKSNNQGNMPAQMVSTDKQAPISNEKY